MKNKPPELLKINLSFPSNYSVHDTNHLQEENLVDFRNPHSNNEYSFELSGQGTTWQGVLSLQENLLSALISCPDPDYLCIISAGETHLVSVQEPNNSIFLSEISPVVQTVCLNKQRLLLLVGFTAIEAISASEKPLWRTRNFSYDGISITDCDGMSLKGLAMGFPPLDENLCPYSLNLITGQVEGGLISKTE